LGIEGGFEIPTPAECAARLHIGTSGWQYDHWRGPFYPLDLPKSRWLAYYSQQLACIEINSSFYGFPSPKAIRSWLDAVPAGFRFALKASRYITHRKKLKDCGEPLQRFLDWCGYFGDRLGPVLFQLPPRWRVNPDRLAAFLDLLPPDLDCAFELRDPSWHTKAVYDLLAARRSAFCQFEIGGLRAPDRITADMIYIRLHGPGEDAYCGSYPDKILKGWVERVCRWLEEGKEVWLFFDNDEAGYAALDALRLSSMLEEIVASGRGSRP
jgi:uncharacterized protein YecE (DUF72 family)